MTYENIKYIIESPRNGNKKIEFVRGFESITNNIFLAKCFDTALGASEYARKVKFEQMGLDSHSFHVEAIDARMS